MPLHASVPEDGIFGSDGVVDSPLSKRRVQTAGIQP